MKSLRTLFINLAILGLLVSCGGNNARKADGIKMIEYISSLNDTVSIPRNCKDFNRFIADSLDFFNVVRHLYAMLEYRPEESFAYSFEFSDSRARLSTFVTSDSTMKFYSFDLLPYRNDVTLVQYKNKNGIHVEFFDPSIEDEKEVLLSYMPGTQLSEEDEESYDNGRGLVTEVNTVMDDRGHPFYIVHFVSSFIPREVFHNIVALTFVNGRPQKVPLFNTGRKRIMNIETYVVYYRDNTWVNGDLIYSYNEDTKDLYIPLIKDTDFQDKYLIYHFDGVEFKYTGIR